MTLKTITFDGKTNGAAAASGDFPGNELFTVTAPSTMTYTTVDGMRGTSALHMSVAAGTGSDVVRIPMNADNAQASYSVILRTPASNPSGFAPMFNIRSTGGRACTLGYSSGGRIYVADGAAAGGTATFVSGASGVTAVAANTEYRFELRLVGNSTTAGKIDCAIYNPTDTSSPIVTLPTITNANLRAELLHGIEIGQNGTGMVAIDYSVEDFQMDDGRTTEIGPILVALATPVITLGTHVDPSAAGTSDGSQVVTWPAVSNAATYDAYKAPKASPAQSDFTLVATGVTSPYTFTGFNAGTDSLGIIAKP